MPGKLRYILLTWILAMATHIAFAQIPNRPYVSQDTLRSKKLTDDQMIDSTRKRLENKKDSVIYTSKFIKVTNEHLLNDSTQVFPLDTGLTNFENYSPLYQPRHPYIGLGNLGLAARPLLFEPQKSIGFDVGEHFLDLYMLNPQDITYYRARVAYTNLYYVAGGLTEQIFKGTHTQNVKSNLNIGADFNTIGSKGFYNRQNVSDINAALFGWYESKNKRYNLLANITFNNMKTPENGSVVNDNIFTPTTVISDPLNASVKLNSSRDYLRNNGLYVKQFYYLGRIDTLKQKDAAKILPTQRVAYTFYYNTRSYGFSQNETDAYKVFPDYFFSPTLSRDSLSVKHLQNDFSYSFYLRGKPTSFVKNELKLDVGVTSDLYHYSQFINDSLQQYTNLPNQLRRVQNATIQNVKLHAELSYRFSNRINLEGSLQQIAEGYNFGDYLYDAKLTLAGGDKAGKIILGAYAQNNKAPLLYTSWISNHYIFLNTDIHNQQTNNISFNYINDKLQLDLKAEYYLINGYQYFAALSAGGNDAAPAQLSTPLNLLKISIGKSITWRHLHFEDYLVYQKSDYQNTIRTPQVYNFANLYVTKLLFNVLNTTLGVNVRYNTSYVAPSYAVGIGQFYNGADVTFSSYPIVIPYVKATIYRTNLFLQYDYANQGLFSDGFYTVNRYPMQSRLLKIGVSWAFYN